MNVVVVLYFTDCESNDILEAVLLVDELVFVMLFDSFFVISAEWLILLSCIVLSFDSIFVVSVLFSADTAVIDIKNTEINTNISIFLIFTTPIILNISKIIIMLFMIISIIYNLLINIL